jgi:hypothetical protein
MCMEFINMRSIDMEFYNAVFKKTVTIKIDSHEVVYNVDENGRFL